jgi:hypothetical protein
MSQILSHPFYQASKELVDKILHEIDTNLSALTSKYIPAESDKKLFFPYSNSYVLLSTVNYFHPQFFFDIGSKVVDKIREHEGYIGGEICKESVYAIMATCAVEKNDILNYRIYLDKMLEQRQLYLSVPTPLIDLINGEPAFGSAKREANRVFNDNSIINKFQKGAFSYMNFTNTCSTLSLFHQQQFVTYILDYRLLHYSLNTSNCPEIIFNQCYSLIQSLCVLTESSLKENKASSKLFWNLLEQDMKALCCQY